MNSCSYVASLIVFGSHTFIYSLGVYNILIRLFLIISIKYLSLQVCTVDSKPWMEALIVV